ncbi:uncharacterized protein LOC126372579 [Pectinophora gossypiella]|uniref:uncharacterized protein LOC126372579 n=1 Tax=Pectinophora gossypiella TaxID=13191 RepID=UPI00214E1859|nr:uncharacterized protein LOC126372579 [Pectinophora gossypiella]
MYFEAFLAGVWASIGSTLGKLTGTASVVGEGYLIWACLLVAMVVANTWGCRHYLRSLDAATNSVAPTVISAASSYVLSGIIGITVFDEGASVRWWAGAMLILLGLGLVGRPRTKRKHTE